MTWIKNHRGALVAFAGACGVFLTAIGVPEGTIEVVLREGGIIAGIAGAVAQAYLSGRGGGES